MILLDQNFLVGIHIRPENGFGECMIYRSSQGENVESIVKVFQDLFWEFKMGRGVIPWCSCDLLTGVA